MVSAATALLLLDVTVVNVAVPAIGEDLGAAFTVAAFAQSFAIYPMFLFLA